MPDVPPFPKGPIKFMRVTVDDHGEIHPLRDAADLDPESYWDDLLQDPRGRVRNGPGHWKTLAARRGSTLIVSCDKCLLREEYLVDVLLQTYSGTMRIEEAAARLTTCNKHAKRCHRTWNLQARNT